MSGTIGEGKTCKRLASGAGGWAAGVRRGYILAPAALEEVVWERLALDRCRGAWGGFFVQGGQEIPVCLGEPGRVHPGTEPPQLMEIIPQKNAKLDVQKNNDYVEGWK